jgi:PPOX class probable FMN-dependent enzyme
VGWDSGKIEAWVGSGARPGAYFRPGSQEELVMDGGGEGKVELRGLYGEPSGLAVVKQMDHIDPYCRQFIALSPFLCLGTSDSEGRQDVSPRGDMPGFVQVLDERTLAIPDRPGNNRLDSLGNLQANPNVGMIFLVPGFDETLRVNGVASLSTDPALLASMAVNGKAPKAAIKIAVREVFLHCGKALKRSKLWDPATQVPRSTLPSLARMILEQTKSTIMTVEQAEARAEKGYRENLW